MSAREFRKRAQEASDWMKDSLEQIETYPVRSQVEAGEILFPLPSVRRTWQTSPAATELEDRVVEGAGIRGVRGTEELLDLQPGYLRPKEGERVNNDREWAVQLGRRFRSRKRWFVIGSCGVEGTQRADREHLTLADWVRRKVEGVRSYELLAPVRIEAVSLRNIRDPSAFPEAIDAENEAILEEGNRAAEAYSTQTHLGGRYAIRFMVGQTNTAARHVEAGWSLPEESACRLYPSPE